MPFSERFVVTSDRGVDREFFCRSAFRSHYFIGNTVVLVLMVAMNAYLLSRWWNRFPPFTVGWMIMSVLWVLPLWGRALRDHAKLQQTLRAGQVGQIELGGPLERALRAAAWMSTWGLFFAFMGVGAMTVALGNVLVSR